jgi:hypothetical protein
MSIEYDVFMIIAQAHKMSRNMSIKNPSDKKQICTVKLGE